MLKASPQVHIILFHSIRRISSVSGHAEHFLVSMNAGSVIRHGNKSVFYTISIFYAEFLLIGGIIRIIPVPFQKRNRFFYYTQL